MKTAPAASRGASRRSAPLLPQASSRSVLNTIRAADRRIRTPRPSAGSVASRRARETLPGGADPLIRREHRGIRDEDRACGFTRSVTREIGSASATGIVSIRAQHDSRGGSEDPHPSAGSAPLGGHTRECQGGADPLIRREHRGIRDEDRACGVTRSVTRETGSASATGIVSIRAQHDSRGGSEDPHPSALGGIRRLSARTRDTTRGCGSSDPPRTSWHTR